MRIVSFWKLAKPRLAIVALLLVMTAGACSTPSSPTPPTPTPTPTPTPVPDPDPPTLACPAPISTSTTDAAGTAVTFTNPVAEKGKEPVTVACTPASGSRFPIGTTAVACTATDALDRRASCSFNVAVSLIPRLTLTHFMAFGDSITSGEITVPIGGGFKLFGEPGSTRQVVVPSASYPTQLKNLLDARYILQRPSIRVTNEGLSGELAQNAQLRFANVVANQRPQVVILMHGYNNISNTSTLTATALQVAIMAAEGRNRQARMFIAGLAPSRQGLRSSIPNDAVQAYNDRLRVVARGEAAVFVDLFSEMIAGVNTFIGGDGLHPNEAGYKKMAEIFLASIQANLEVR